MPSRTAPARTLPERAGRAVHRAFCAAVLLFLIAPLLVFVPVSFDADLSTGTTMGPTPWWSWGVTYGQEWLRALLESVAIGATAAVLATVLGTMAALGLSSPAMPGRAAVMGLVLSPIVTPLIAAAFGMFFLLYPVARLAETYLGRVLAHAALGAPLVVVTVTAALSGFDRTLLRAAASLGAGPLTGFGRVQLPLIAPGVACGALFAFATSFHELATLFFIGTPRQSWSGIGDGEGIGPAILIVAAVLLVFALLFMATVAWLRRRRDREGRTRP